MLFPVGSYPIFYSKIKSFPVRKTFFVFFVSLHRALFFLKIRFWGIRESIPRWVIDYKNMLGQKPETWLDP